MKHLHTRGIHAGHHATDEHGAVKPAVYRTSTFTFPDAETGAAHMESKYGIPGAVKPESGYIYSRLDNPTNQACEVRLAAWDGAEKSAVFASGMAAISTALLAWSGANRPVWFVGPVYGGTDHFLRHVLPNMGVEVGELRSLNELEERLNATGQTPGIIYLETPANPTMQMHRISTAAAFAKKHQTEDHPIQVMVDNTYLGPILQRPLEHGADLVIYSATKYLGGHSDLIAGAVSGNAEVVDQVRQFRNFLGGIAAPDTAWMLLRSMETLHLRVERQQENAQAVAHFLRQHPNVEDVISAFTEDLNAEQHEVATAQTAGGGSMLAFRVNGARKEAFKVLNALKIFGLAVSLGSTESLAEHPASMTHAGVPPEEKELHGITENLIRLSIGVEHVSDLIADLQQALATLNTSPLAPAEIPVLSGTGKN